jgi:hypothetical protein
MSEHGLTQVLRSLRHTLSPPGADRASDGAAPPAPPRAFPRLPIPLPGAASRSRRRGPCRLRTAAQSRP